jgi:hypothetical protein
MPLFLPAVASPVYRMVAGEWYGTLDAPLTSVIPAEGQTRYVQFVAERDLVLNGIGAEFTVAGTAGAVIKLVIKADDGGRPAASTLWSSTGLDAAGSPGLLSADPSHAVSAGSRRWLGCNVQGGAGTRPTLRCLNVRHGPVPSGTGAAACWAASGETADSFAAPVAANTNPVAVMVRVAA